MHALYNIGILLFGLSIRLASIFKEKPSAWIKGRKNLYHDAPNVSDKTVIWFHCASLGEFDQGLPLMNKIKKNYPDYFILVTFFSPSGMSHYHKRNHRADYVSYLALDTPSNAKKFIDQFKPKKAYFVKYEFWSNHIFAAKNQGTALYNISGLFRDNQRFFKSFGSFFRKTLRQFDCFFVQNNRSKELLNSINIDSVEVTGDSRFDRVIENSNNIEPNEIIESFAMNEKIVVIGSSWPKDEELLIKWINENPKQKILLAPHNINGKTINPLTDQLNNSILYTKASKSTVSEFQVLILDTIGHLSSAYSYGEIAYVGGGFSGKLHNILEPAVFGLPVVFGPHHDKYPEAQQFINAGIGFSISTREEFQQTFKQINQSLESISTKCKSFVEQQKGASDKIMTITFNAS